MFPVWVKQKDPFVASDGKSIRRDRFAVPDAFEQRIPGDDVFVFP